MEKPKWSWESHWVGEIFQFEEIAEVNLQDNVSEIKKPNREGAPVYESLAKYQIHMSNMKPHKYRLGVSSKKGKMTWEL